jgi:hypothetical protein
MVFFLHKQIRVSHKIINRIFAFYSLFIIQCPQRFNTLCIDDYLETNRIQGISKGEK